MPEPDSPAVTVTPHVAKLTPERRAELDAAGTRWTVENGQTANTTAAFRQDWRAWREFCAEVGVDEHEVSSGLLVLFAQWLATGDEANGRAPASPATIRRRFSGVLAGWRAAECDVPRGVTSDALSAVKIYERELAKANEKRGRGQAPPMTLRQLRELVAACPDTLAGARDRAVILIGFAIGARRSELADLAVGDLTDDPAHGLVVDLRHSKVGPRESVIPWGQNERTCPVRAWHAWRSEAGLDNTDAAFVQLTKADTRRMTPDRYGRPGGMTPHAIGELIKRASRRAGIAGVPLTGHSMRVGMATEARRAGHDMLTIAKQGGWNPGSEALYRYTRIVDRWADNALIGIGL